MILDFDSTETTVLPHFKGGEKELSAEMYADARNRIMRIGMEPGASVGEHRHETSSEIIFALQGEAAVYYNGVREVLRAGQCHYCPQGETHTMVNESGAPFHGYAVVPEHDTSGRENNVSGGAR